MKKYKLIALNVDGAVIQDYHPVSTPHPEILKILKTLPAKTKIAVITNQGGPACHDAGWETSYRYPCFEDVEGRILTIRDALAAEIGRSVIHYICYAYITNEGQVILPAAKQHELEIFNWRFWRLPSPGMLLQAQDDAGVADGYDCLYVGDEDIDRIAAEALGWGFMWTRNFVVVDSNELGRRANA